MSINRRLIRKLQPTTGRDSVTTEQAGEQMPVPVRCSAKWEQVGGAAESTRAFLEAAGASTKPAQKAMELWRGEQREKRPEAVRQHFVLPARDTLFFPRPPPFIGQGAVRH